MYTADLRSEGHAFIAEGQTGLSSSWQIFLCLLTLQRRKSPCKLGNSALIFSINALSDMERGTTIFFMDNPAVKEERKTTNVVSALQVPLPIYKTHTELLKTTQLHIFGNDVIVLTIRLLLSVRKIL